MSLIEPTENLVPLQVVIDFLQAEDWPVHRVGEQTILQTAFQGNNGAWTCFVNCRAEFGQVLVYSIAPLQVPEAMLPAMAEYLTHANWGLMIGNFELDFADGEVRYKTSLQLENTLLTADLLRPLVFDNVVVMDKYLPGIQAVSQGDLSPEAAIQTIEG